MRGLYARFRLSYYSSAVGISGTMYARVVKSAQRKRSSNRPAACKVKTAGESVGTAQ